jgi:putative transposase
MAEKYNNKYRIASARLSNWDYRRNAAYFVTICTQNRQPFFGHIETVETLQCNVSTMVLSQTGKIAENCWREISIHFPFVVLGEFVVMPNHVHGIVVIDNAGSAISGVETLHCHVSTDETVDDEPSTGKNEFMASISPKPGSLSTIIRSYKSAVSKLAHVISPEFGWQERFHDHIIRDEGSFILIQNYIVSNVQNWKADKFY